MIEIGIYNSLTVVKEVDFGVYLEGDKFGEILLPKRYVPKDCEIDDIIEVFIYKDSEDRIIATTEKPYAVVGEFAFLKVAAVTAIGAFLDWGLMKDLLVPFREQKEKRMEKGKSYIVRVCLDEKTERIIASAKVGKFLDLEPASYKEEEEVDLIICSYNDLGYKAIINNSHMGQIYKNEVFESLNIGRKIKGYIKKIRKDGKIDLCLQKEGYEKIDDISQNILKKLEAAGGFIAVTDKSPPDLIYKMFGISKKSYKKAVGALFKQKVITIENAGIRLNT
ncbi:S1 RNA-binding domain-containing protein [Elusimicrobiota bacterium]